MPPEINPPIENVIHELCVNDQQLEHTSDWSKQKIDSYKIAINCNTWASKFATSVPEDPSDVYPPAFNLMVSKSIYVACEDLKASQKPFYNRLNRLRKRPNCPDANIAYDLLTHTGFDDGPTHFISQTKLETRISTMTVVSDANYVVIGQFPSLAYMVVIEDTCGNQTFEKRRYQMAGDMTVAAMIRHTFLSQNGRCPSSTNMFGMLVWRSDVSFYQVTFTHEDVTKRQSECPTPVSNTIVDEHLVQRKFCPTKATFSLFDREDRSSVVSILLGMKKEISRFMSDL
jgi:hypothetical protein